MGFLRTDNAFMLAGDGLLQDLEGYGCIDLSAPWWDGKVNEKHMIGGKLFLAVGQASVNDLLRTHLILFNSNLFDDEKRNILIPRFRRGHGQLTGSESMQGR